jgi:SAM-dependent methyltransferase
MEKYLEDLFVISSVGKSRVPGWLIRLYLTVFDVPLGKTIRIDMVRQLLKGYEMRGKRVLDVGCGVGDLSLLMAHAGAEVIGVELDPQKVESATKVAKKWHFDNVRFIAGDVTKIEHMSLGQFDVIFCIALLEHIKDDAGLLRQIHGLLRPEGFFVLEVPSALRKTIPEVEAEDGHARPGYVFEDVPAFLEKAGIRVLRKCTRDPLGLFYHWCRLSRLIPGPRARGQLFAVLAPVFIALIRITSLFIEKTGTELGFLGIKQ